MKKINNVFDKALTYENLLLAYERAKKNKGCRLEILQFEEKLEINLMNLLFVLKNGNYKIGNYRVFRVYEPKERIIKALPFVDRIVHQWYVYEFLIPYVVPKFIYDSYACLDNKGTHKASYRLRTFFKKNKRKYDEFYIIKMDIKKFFYNIDQNILFNIVKRHFKDKKLLQLTMELIFDKDSKIGIPIGNYTSQYFANMYLNELDYYVKFELKLKYYLRYMDDFVIIVKNKEEARMVYKEVEQFIINKLKLELNHKSRIYPSKMGVDFCGYRVFHNFVLVRKRSIKKIKSNLKLWKHETNNRCLDIDKVLSSLNSWLAHINHSNSYNLGKKYYYKTIILVYNYALLTLPLNVVDEYIFPEKKVQKFLNELTFIE